MSETPSLIPFVPSWLDDAGLSQAEFRLYCHLCRRADNQTGIAWPSYKAMMETCGSGKTTIRRCLEHLAGLGLIARVGKPFGGSCRYRVFFAIVPPQGQLDAINSSITGTIDAPPILPSQDRNSSTRGTPIVPPEGHEGSPKKVLQVRKSKNEVSPEGIEFAIWFKTTLPETIILKANWQQSFGESYDELVRLDKRLPEEIRKISQWARTESFWQSNFMSPAKLRKRNGDGITYFDVFAEKMKQPPGPSSKPTPTTINQGTRRGAEVKFPS